jgi:hypothetical protein
VHWLVAQILGWFLFAYSSPLVGLLVLLRLLMAQLPLPSSQHYLQAFSVDVVLLIWFWMPAFDALPSMEA